MTSDSQTNLLFLADCLPKKFPNFFKELEKILDELSIEYKFLSGTNDVWAVDYMPVQVAKNKFIQFDYDPDYLRFKKWHKTISDTRSICKRLGIEPILSKIKIDGGNVIRSCNKAIMTNKVFSENPDIEESILVQDLKSLFEIEELIIIPKDPNDFTGHADGMVRFINENKVFINKYGSKDINLERAIKDCLHNASLDWIEIPCNPYENKSKIDAKGLYINYLQMKDVIIVPFFGLSEDDNALRQIENSFSMNAVKTIECSELAKEGGVLNCISWNIFG